MKRVTISCAIAAIVAGCNQQAGDQRTASDSPVTTEIGLAQLRDADGASIGTAALVFVEDEGIALSVDIAGLAAGGTRGFHLHTTGQCDTPDFASAGGHLNPDGSEHGTENPAGKHLGDLPNLKFDDQGRASTRVALTGAQGDLMAVLFDEDGTSVVLHAEADDYVTDPTGNAGARIACGVLEKAQ